MLSTKDMGFYEKLQTVILFRLQALEGRISEIASETEEIPAGTLLAKNGKPFWDFDDVHCRVGSCKFDAIWLMRTMSEAEDKFIHEMFNEVSALSMMGAPEKVYYRMAPVYTWHLEDDGVAFSITARVKVVMEEDKDTYNILYGDTIKRVKNDREETTS